MQLTIASMERTSYLQMRCSLARSLEKIGDWWSPLIVRDLYLGVVRFDDLVEDLGISRNLLASRLKVLISNGIVKKRIYQRRPPRYEYRLSEAGNDLLPVIVALTAWGDRWARPRQGRPVLYEHIGCGHCFDATVVCSECWKPVSADTVRAVRGPGGAAMAGTKVLARRLPNASRSARS